MRVRASGVTPSCHQRSPDRPPELAQVAEAPVTRRVGHRADEDLGAAQLLRGGVGDPRRALQRVRRAAPVRERRVLDDPAGGEHAPEPALEPELLLDDQVREVVRHAAGPAADPVPAPALELDGDAVRPVQRGAIAGGRALVNVDPRGGRAAAAGHRARVAGADPQGGLTLFS